MPGFVAHLGATVLCAHAGQAQPTAPYPRVLVSRQPVTTIVAPYAVAGCALPPAAGGPCVTGQWLTGTTRVLAGGAPLVIQGAQSLCVPTGSPMNVLVSQVRVRAT
jgi:hypothetical protein